MSKIYNTWVERIDAPVMQASMIRQFKDAIALRALTDHEGGRRTSLTSAECNELWEGFRARTRRDGGPKVSEVQAEQGRRWLDRYWKKIGMPEADYRAIVCFRFVGVQIFNESSRWPTAYPVYECDWGNEFARLRYVPVPWQAQGPPTAEFWWVYATDFQKLPEGAPA